MTKEKTSNLTSWPTVPFPNCLDELDIKKPRKVLARDYERRGTIPIIDQGQDLIAGWTSEDSVAIRDQLPFIVFGDHTRIFKFVDFPFALGADGTQLLKPADIFNPRFFYYACLHLALPNRGYNRHFTLLKEQQLPRPPKSEQENIAAVMLKVERAIRAEQLLIATSRELKKSAMTQLFTHGLRNEPQRETEIGVLPSSWRVVPLSEIVTARGGSPFPHAKQGKKSGGFPFYKVSDMNLPGNELLMTKSVNWVDEQDLVSLKAKTFPSRTVIFPKVGGALFTNKKRILTQPSVVDNNVMGVIAKDADTCLPEFLFQWFLSIDLGQLANPGPLPSINSSRLYETFFPLPDKNEQKSIVEALDKIDRKISVHERKHATLQELFKTLLHELMVGQIRVHKLDIDLSEVQS
jgi:type I restriction enzyme S subunit